MNFFRRNSSKTTASTRTPGFTPASGTPGVTVIISGLNFSPTPSNNIVYFGAVRAMVTAANSTALNAIVKVTSWLGSDGFADELTIPVVLAFVTVRVPLT